jgi:hypothetical protein
MIPPPPMIHVGHAHHDFDLVFGNFFGFNFYIRHHADTDYSEHDPETESEEDFDEDSD